MVRGTGFILLVAVVAPVWTPATMAGQLPNCTINFDDTCPDVTPECGATFSGGDGCNVIGEANCYSSGFFSYQVGQGGSLTITLSDDLTSLSVFFAHQVTGGAGGMTFLDSGGQEVDAPITTNGPCVPGPMPATQVVFFSRPVRTIEVDNTGDDNIWIDTFEVNPPCNDAGDCDDSDPCTSDMCEAGNCTHPPMDCDDGVACTDDACVAGACVSTPDDSNCPDDGEFCNGIENCHPLLGCGSSGDPCQAGQFCNEATETCNGCIADGDCDDGDASTNDACVDGTCVFILPTGDCPADLDGDGDVGASDLANLLGSWGPNVGHPADLTGDGSVGAEDLAILLGSWGPCSSSDSSECQNDEDCDDDNACTENDQCFDGACVGGAPPDCDDLDPCTDDSCDEVEGCQHDNNTAPCDDDDACTEGDVCTAGSCGGSPVDCSLAGDQCNDASCDPDGADGNCGILTPVADDTPCDDEDACTEGDVCTAGSCGGSPVDCSLAGNQCNDASCDPDGADGNCDILTPVADDTPCDDEDGMMDDEEMDSNGCGAGSCGAAGGVSLAWILAALSAARVARRRGWPAGKR